jgi:hypothetical protein
MGKRARERGTNTPGPERRMGACPRRRASLEMEMEPIHHNRAPSQVSSWARQHWGWCPPDRTDNLRSERGPARKGRMVAETHLVSSVEQCRQAREPSQRVRPAGRCMPGRYGIRTSDGAGQRFGHLEETRLDAVFLFRISPFARLLVLAAPNTGLGCWCGLSPTPPAASTHASEDALWSGRSGAPAWCRRLERAVSTTPVQVPPKQPQS